jgi:hypothetical protein
LVHLFSKIKFVANPLFPQKQLVEQQPKKEKKKERKKEKGGRNKSLRVPKNSA